MICQRWGSFSVRDHLQKQAFVLEALLYDRLVIPVPPENDPLGRKRWIGKRWKPNRLESFLEILGEDLASRIPWTRDMQQTFRTRSAAAHQITEEVAYGTTPFILAEIDPASRPDLFPNLPADEPKPRILPAYPSRAEARKDIQIEIEVNQKERLIEERDLAFTICRRFLTPKPPGIFSPRGVRLEKELLQQAADLARDDEFKTNRRQFFEWEEDVIHKGYSTEDSIEQMRNLLNAHEKIVRRAWKNTTWRRMLTVFVIGSSAAGGAISLSAGNVAAAAAAAVGVVAGIGRFIKLDYKPVVQSDQTAPAVMIHTIRKRLDLEPT